MNNLVFPFLLVLLITACQNTPKSASDAPVPETPAAPAVITSEEMQQVSTSLSSGISKMEDLRKKVDALPATVRKEKATEIEVFYAELEGMIEKQTIMINTIKSASVQPDKHESASQESEGAAGLNPADFMDYKESAARYAKSAQEIEEALNKMGAKKN